MNAVALLADLTIGDLGALRLVLAALASLACYPATRRLEELAAQGLAARQEGPAPPGSKFKRARIWKALGRTSRSSWGAIWGAIIMFVFALASFFLGGEGKVIEGAEWSFLWADLWLITLFGGLALFAPPFVVEEDMELSARSEGRLESTHRLPWAILLVGLVVPSLTGDWPDYYRMVGVVPALGLLPCYVTGIDIPRRRVAVTLLLVSSFVYAAFIMSAVEP